MPDRREQIRKEIEELVGRGVDLYRDEAAYWSWEEESGEEKPESAAFNPRYHSWYSVALPLIKQLAPERLEEFELYFRDPKVREVSWQNYTIQHHIGGIRTIGMPARRWASFALTKFAAQLNILSAVAERLDGLLVDVVGVLQADLFDDELSVARELQKKKHLRAAGAVAGVVLERHLGNVASTRAVSPKKRSPTIGDFNESLRYGGAYDLPQYRRIQHLADIRNLAVHSKERDPTSAEVDDLISGVEQVIKNVF